jgi:hypothetical protein
MSSYRELSAVVVCFLIAATVWWIVYAGPNTARLNKISTCMGDNLSMESYESCVQQIRK